MEQNKKSGLLGNDFLGYFMRDGEIKLSRRSSQLVDEVEEEASPADALPEAGARVKKNVSGSLSWWDPSRNERTYLSPQTYIHRLESEIEALKQQHDAAASNGAGETSARYADMHLDCLNYTSACSAFDCCMNQQGVQQS